jgi:hypothetical protein
MDVTINLSEQNAAALEAQALAAHMPPERYLRDIVARALQEYQHSPSGNQQTRGQGTVRSKKSAHGLLARYGPGPTEEEIDENRREMFSGFGEIAP